MGVSRLCFYLLMTHFLKKQKKKMKSFEMSNLDIKVFALGYNLSQIFSSATWDQQAFFIYLFIVLRFFLFFCFFHLALLVKSAKQKFPQKHYIFTVVLCVMLLATYNFSSLCLDSENMSVVHQIIYIKKQLNLNSNNLHYTLRKKKKVQKLSLGQCLFNLYHLGGILYLGVHFMQSRSSLYAEYTGCVGPPKHQGAPVLSKMF